MWIGLRAALVSLVVLTLSLISVPAHGAEGIQLVSDTYSTPMDTTLNVPAPGVFENDGITGTSYPAVLVSGPTVGKLTLRSDGSFQFIPPKGYAGIATFVYQVTGPTGAISRASVNITVVDSRPVASMDTYSVGSGLFLNVSAPGLLANDTDPANKALQVVAVTSPANGSVIANSNGAFTYVSTEGFVGQDGFEYTVSNGTGESTASVRIDVAAGGPGQAKPTLTGGGVAGSAASLPASGGSTGGSSGGSTGGSSGGSTTDGSAPSGGALATNPDLKVSAKGVRSSSSTWTVKATVKNVGGASTNAKVTVAAAASKGVTLIKVSSPKGWTCKVSGGKATCTTKASLAPKKAALFTYRVSTTKGASRTLGITATTKGDARKTNNAVTVKVPAA